MREPRTSEHQVVIVGGGPTGMTLAAELALGGVDVVIVERRPDHTLAGSRAGGLHSRTIELFDQRGIADRFLAEGQIVQVATFGTARLDLSDFPTRHPYSLGIWQNAIERILAEWIAELGVRVVHGCEVTGFEQNDDGVVVRLDDGRSLRAEYLVGCDGGRSVVRRAAGIAFPGWEATRSNLIGEVEMREEPPMGVRHDALGVHGIGRVDYEIVDGEVVFADSGPVRVTLTEERVGGAGGGRAGGDRAAGVHEEPSLSELSETLVRVYGTDFGVHSPTWISRFTDATRQAERYRDRRVLLAGDAAHVHYPVGGQGLNLGVHDAMNLGWKLARIVDGSCPETLLDTYEAERHPVTARVLRHAMALGALQRRDERMQALVEVISEVAAMDEPRRMLAGVVSGLDVHYDVGEGHPLLGRRMPDFDLGTAERPVRVFELLRDAQPLLLNFDDPGALEVGPWVDRVRLIDATHEGEWQLPVLGPVAAPSAVLVRPDGTVAWIGDGTDVGLNDALATWFGPPKAR